MSDTYRIEIGTSLNTKEAQAALDGFIKKSSKLSVINFKDGSKQFRNLTTWVNGLGQAYKTLTTQMQSVDGQLGQEEGKIIGLSRNMQDLSNQMIKTGTNTRILADGTKIIAELGEAGQKTVTIVKQYTNANGELVKETTKLNAVTKETLSQNKEIIKDEQAIAAEKRKRAELQKELNTTITTEKKTITDLGKQYEALVKTTVEQQANGEKLTTVVSKYTNELGQTVVKTEKFNQANEKVSNTTRVMTSEMDKTAQGVGRLGQKFSDIVTKVSKFYLATIPIQALRRALTTAMQTVKDFDKAITEMGKVSDYSGKKLDDYTRKLGELGKEVGRTRKFCASVYSNMHKESV